MYPLCLLRFSCFYLSITLALDSHSLFVVYFMATFMWHVVIFYSLVWFTQLLFVLIADVLSTMFTHALSSKVLYRVSLGNLGQVCHLQYAYYLIFLSSVEKRILMSSNLVFFCLRACLVWPLTSTKHVCFPQSLIHFLAMRIYKL